jgi:hypothetical protein
MERDTFDRLVRLIAAASSRRAALRLATGAVLGGAATLESAAAKRRTRGRVRAQQAEPFCGDQCGVAGNCDNKKIGPGANLSGCNFNEVQFGPSQTNLVSTNISGACFVKARFLGFGGKLRSANASNACFTEADLESADFRGTNLSGAIFCGADLRGADFRGSNVTKEQLDCANVGCDTILPNGKPAVVCTGGKICCTSVCCDPQNCDGGTCVV